MTSRRDKFPDQPETLPIDVESSGDEVTPRFNPSQHRAFGSAPNLLGRTLEIPALEHIPEKAWTRTDIAVIHQGLYGDSANYMVQGVALSPEYYEAIIRNQKSFLGSTAAKTVAANRLVNPERQQEKLEKSQVAPLESKQARHQAIIPDLQSQQENLETLLEWQRVRGWWRTDEADLRIRTTQAWQQTFVGMLRTLKDNYDLSANDEIDMQQALAYRLFRGEQNERMRQWGNYLREGAEYTRRIKILFEQSDRKIGRALADRTIESPNQ